MDLLGLNMPPAILLGADEVIEQDARARKLKLSRSQLGTWTKDSFGSKAVAEHDARRRRNLRRYRTPTGTKRGCISENRRFDQHTLPAMTPGNHTHRASCQPRTPKMICTMRCTSPNRFASRS